MLKNAWKPECHSALVRITNNELLLIAFNTIRAVYEDYTKSVFERGYRDQSFADHSAIIEALRANDAEMARQMMRRHLEHVECFRGNN